MSSDGTYEYRDMLASTWDLIRGDMSDSPDRRFFRDIVQQSGEPALDVGCGTGRLLLDFLADGVQIEGVDVSPEMIELCRRKAQERSLRPALYVQAIETLDLPRQYRTIIVPSSTFQLVTDQQAARVVLDRFREHLLPGGMLALSVWHIKRDGPAEWSDWYLIAEIELPEDGRVVRRQERSMYDPQTQLRHTENLYELLEDGHVVNKEEHRRSPELRNYTLVQMSDLLRQARFEEVHAVSAYSDEPATAGDGTFCIIGRKARVEPKT